MRKSVKYLIRNSLMKKCSAQDKSQVDLNFSKVVHPAITLNDESQTLLSVTAYNNNIGHIHDVRSINIRDSGHTVIESVVSKR